MLCVLGICDDGYCDIMISIAAAAGEIVSITLEPVKGGESNKKIVKSWWRVSSLAILSRINDGCRLSSSSLNYRLSYLYLVYL